MVERTHLSTERGQFQASMIACEQKSSASREACEARVQKLKDENVQLQSERYALLREREILRQEATACTQKSDSACVAETLRLKDKLEKCERQSLSSRKSCLEEMERLRAKSKGSEPSSSSAEVFDLPACPEMRTIPPSAPPLPGGLWCRVVMGSGKECCK